MSLRACICEDDLLHARILKNILGSYIKEKKIACDIITYPNGLSFFHDFEEGYTYPDVLFIDIMLGDSNGVSICKELRKRGYKGTIIFVTGLDEYALDGYDVDARGYILKPYQATYIHNTLDRILRNSGAVAYTIKVYNQIIRIPIADILYFESQNTKCVIHCIDNVIYTIYKKLGDVEEELSGNGFLRSHRSYLVNMSSIASAGAAFVLKNGESVPIRTKNAKEIKNIYMEYLKRFI